MASLVEMRLDRKQFINGRNEHGGRLSVDEKPSASGTEPGGANRFALLSDTHIASDAGDSYRGFVPSTNLKAIIQQMLDQPFEMAMLNGDAARLEGLEGDYAQLVKILEPLRSHCPITIGLGNHDDRDQFRKAFSIELTDFQKAAQRHVVVIESGPRDLVGLGFSDVCQQDGWALGQSPANVAQELSGRGVGEIGKADPDHGPPYAWGQRRRTDGRVEPLGDGATISASEGHFLRSFAQI